MSLEPFSHGGPAIALRLVFSRGGPYSSSVNAPLNCLVDLEMRGRKPTRRTPWCAIGDAIDSLASRRCRVPGPGRELVIHVRCASVKNDVLMLRWFKD